MSHVGTAVPEAVLKPRAVLEPEAAREAVPKPAPPAGAAALAGPPGWVILLAVWALLVVKLVAASWGEVGVRFNDTDDASRLLQVRDWLAGQSWFDPSQHRYGPPGADAPTHWSRLVDLPIAALVLVGRALLGPGLAERFALTAYPPLTGLGAMLAAAWGARALAGPGTAGRLGFVLAGALVAACLPVQFHFVPGRLDHHNVQMVMTLALLALGAGPDTARRGAAGGALSALMLAVGGETLPFVVAHAAWLAARLAGRAAPAPALARRAAGFGAALALAAPALLLATAPPARWLASYCDGYGLNAMLGALAGGAGLAALGAALAAVGSAPGRPAARRPEGRASRVAALAGAGALALAAYLGARPSCWRGPFADVDPRLFPLWLDHVDEMAPLHRLALTEPTIAVAVGLAVLGALGAALALIARRPSPGAALALVFVVVGAALGLAHIRAAGYAVLLGAPPAAALIGMLAARRGTGDGRLLRALLGLIALNATTATVLAHGVVGGGRALALLPPAVEDTARTRGCQGPPIYAALAGLAPALAAAPIDIGPFLVVSTHHAALASPYHRNATGILAADALLAARPERARALAASAGVGLVVACAGDLALARGEAPDGLLAALARGEVPAWLEPVPGTAAGPLRAWRVRPAP